MILWEVTIAPLGSNWNKNYSMEQDKFMVQQPIY